MRDKRPIQEEIERLKLQRDAAREFSKEKIDQIKELNSEIESLKAITELAVKGLTVIKNMLDFDHSDYQKFQIWQAATDPLKEIERLQNAHIQPKSPS